MIHDPPKPSLIFSLARSIYETIKKLRAPQGPKPLTVLEIVEARNKGLMTPEEALDHLMKVREHR